MSTQPRKSLSSHPSFPFRRKQLAHKSHRGFHERPPITQKRTQFQQSTLVSTTHLKGQITRNNRTFLNVSGYTKAVFNGFWDTIKTAVGHDKKGNNLKKDRLLALNAAVEAARTSDGYRSDQ